MVRGIYINALLFLWMCQKEVLCMLEAFFLDLLMKMTELIGNSIVIFSITSS